MRPFFTQADIERLYRDSDAPAVELSAELIEHHIRRGRVMRAQVAADLFGRAGRAVKRLLGKRPFDGAGERGHGELKPSNV